MLLALHLEFQTSRFRQGHKEKKENKRPNTPADEKIANMMLGIIAKTHVLQRAQSQPA